MATPNYAYVSSRLFVVIVTLPTKHFVYLILLHRFTLPKCERTYLIACILIPANAPCKPVINKLRYTRSFFQNRCNVP